MPSLNLFARKQRCCCALITLLATQKTTSAQHGVLPVQTQAAVTRLGQEFVSTDRSDALSIAILQPGKVVFFNFGTTERGKQSPPTERSVYEIGSITKIFTSLLLAHAVLDRKLALDDDLRRHLPGAYPNLTFERTPVRLIDLADTTSALPDNLPDFQQVTAHAPEEQKAFVLADVLDHYTQQTMLHDLHSVSLASKPGVTPRHSNLAAELLGYIVTQAYGQTFASLLQSKVQAPFGMRNGVRADDPAQVVHGYDAQHRSMPETSQPAVLAAGGLRFSAQDMANFLQAELAANDQAVRLTQQPVIGTPDTGAVGWNWQISRNTEGALKLNASGGTAGSASYVELYPEHGYGLALLANRSGEAEGRLYDLADTLFAAVVGTPALDALKADLTKTHFADVESSVQRSRALFPHLTLSEPYVNNWAGGLLGSDPKAALALFQFNAQHWPASSNAFDSLGEGYEQLGKRSEAISAYRKALELNPANTEAAASLASLQSRQTAH